MSRRRSIVLAVALYAAAVVSALAGWWVGVGLVGMAVTYLAGRFDWLRVERRAVWAAADGRYRQEIRQLGTQLARLEAAEAARAEAEHARIRGGGGWGNGAGYRSRLTADDQAIHRPGVASSTTPTPTTPVLEGKP